MLKNNLIKMNEKRSKMWRFCGGWVVIMVAVELCTNGENVNLAIEPHKKLR